MKVQVVALFGEAEKGEFHTPYLCKELHQLADSFGNPPRHSQGLEYAVQALLYHCHLLFFRVREEGFSEQDYFAGMKQLRVCSEDIPIAAICMPGVGNCKIIEAVTPICAIYQSILLISPADLYDYMTTHRCV